jgi:serine/threonine protein kinase
LATNPVAQKSENAKISI